MHRGDPAVSLGAELLPMRFERKPVLHRDLLSRWSTNAGEL